ncbi:hypothetical protein DICSQDRAFT_173412 [Dichomitus squalens LYAD-421 SS1]|uniref:Uncharacterized protein n=1 Tax=Dichomitus squalens (strain LYAD-421) TaxID=732165 RepID=R7SPP7_DICSQ|nr:uncharacterized protein DICSQDRAFT_173412 [Dichomitus squalens LYAD-421 SS1]EJF57918.1 hypothetical protein DICSQDRAFT_173412 [Dichomitus squalens LYAD-421 SS1]
MTSSTTVASTSALGPDGRASLENSERPKLTLRKFVWGDKLVRKTLPQATIPPWLDPLHVDVDDPKKLPLCWYGVEFLSDLFFKFAERVGLAAYLKFTLGHMKAGNLDIFETWIRFTDWFENKSGLKLDLIKVWGHDVPIMTVFSNHEIPRITDQMWRDACDLLDDMEFPDEFQLEWYLDRRLASDLSSSHATPVIFLTSETSSFLRTARYKNS